MTTEELINGLTIMRGDYHSGSLNVKILDVAIERLRGDEWPVVMTNGPWLMVMHKCRIGSYYDADTYLRLGEARKDISWYPKDGFMKLTGPARAEVLERLGIKEAGK